MDEELQCVFVAHGEIHTQQIRSFLEAAGIRTAIRGDSLRQTHGLTLAGPGAVEILVSDADAEQARDLLRAAEAGDLRLGDEAESDTGETR